MKKTTRLLSLIALALLLAACNPQQEAKANEQRPADNSVAATDSVFSIEEQVDRFKAELAGPPPTTLTGGAASRDELVAMLVRAVESNDRAKGESMSMTAWEFIELYYPHTVFMRPPYELEPQHVWLYARADNDKGFGRLFDRYGGDSLNFSGYSCTSEPEQEERNRIWRNCVVNWNPNRGAPTEMQIFSAIIERYGHYKFLSYANDF